MGARSSLRTTCFTDTTEEDICKEYEVRGWLFLSFIAGSFAGKSE
jgi:hypothetical protein